MMSEWRGLVFFFFFLTSRSAVDGGMEGCGEEKEEGGMYVEYVRWLPVFFSSLSFSPSGKERLDWRLGSRTGVIARGVKPFRLSRGTFDLDLPGVVGTDSKSFFVNGTVNPTCSPIHW